MKSWTAMSFIFLPLIAKKKKSQELLQHILSLLSNVFLLQWPWSEESFVENLHWDEISVSYLQYRRHSWDDSNSENEILKSKSVKTNLCKFYLLLLFALYSVDT